MRPTLAAGDQGRVLHRALVGAAIPAALGGRLELRYHDGRAETLQLAPE